MSRTASVAFGALLGLALVLQAQAEEIALQEPDDLEDHYARIFRTGNRNAAAHLWASYLISHKANHSSESFSRLFRGFCSVSGMPIPDQKDTMYKATLPRIGNGTVTGVVRFSCWPCLCDANEHVHVDSKTIQLSDGPRSFDWLVIGDPCKNPLMLEEQFVDPISRKQTSLSDTAPEIECLPTGRLRGATYSDHDHVIIGMFFTDEESIEVAKAVPTSDSMSQDDPTFGFSGLCRLRKEQGYQSGMGVVFHRVADITPIGPSIPWETEAADMSAVSEQVELAPSVMLPPLERAVRRVERKGVPPSVVLIAALCTTLLAASLFLPKKYHPSRVDRKAMTSLISQTHLREPTMDSDTE